MNRKYKITEFVKCFADRGEIHLNGEIGKVIGYNRDGTYNVLFGYNRFDPGAGYYLTLFEGEIESINKKIDRLDVLLDVVFLPSGEVIRIDDKDHSNLRARFLIWWDNRYGCYVSDDKKKNSILKNI